MNGNVQILGIPLTPVRDDEKRGIVVYKGKCLDKPTTIIEQNLLPELLADIETLTKKKPTFRTTDILWPEKVKNIVEKLKVYLRDAYIVIDKRQNKIDIALRVELKPDEMQDESEIQVLSDTAPFNLITFESMVITVWKTDNSKIIREMNIVDFRI